MNRRVILALAFFVLWTAGCRQADGPPPPSDKEVPNRLEDLGKDVGNVAAGHAEATQDLADDLKVFVDTDEKPDAAAAIDELARRVAAALSGRQLTKEGEARVARQLWLTVASRELSEKQLENLQADVRTMGLGLGVTEPLSQALAAQAGEVQKRVTDRQRRWYELF